jgi:hypothetical protein
MRESESPTPKNMFFRSMALAALLMPSVACAPPTAPTRKTFDEYQYKYKTLISVSEDRYSGTLQLYSQERPELTHNGQLSILLIREGVCPVDMNDTFTSWYGVSRDEVLRREACTPQIRDYRRQTTRDVTIVALVRP